MLSEFIQRQRQLEPAFEALSSEQQAGVKLKGLVDFLKDPNRFPNAEVNALITLTSELITHGNVEVSLIEQRDQRVQTMLFASAQRQFPGRGIGVQGVIMLAPDFVHQVNSDPVMLLITLAMTASNIRDAFTGHFPLTRGSIQQNQARGNAYAGEVVRTLQQMAQQEGLNIDLSPYIQQYPSGLGNLPRGVQYPTPNYPR